MNTAIQYPEYMATVDQMTFWWYWLLQAAIVPIIVLVYRRIRQWFVILFLASHVLSMIYQLFPLLLPYDLTHAVASRSVDQGIYIALLSLRSIAIFMCYQWFRKTNTTQPTDAAAASL